MISGFEVLVDATEADGSVEIEVTFAKAAMTEDAFTEGLIVDTFLLTAFLCEVSVLSTAAVVLGTITGKRSSSTCTSVSSASSSRDNSRLKSGRKGEYHQHMNVVYIYERTGSPSSSSTPSMLHSSESVSTSNPA